MIQLDYETNIWSCIYRICDFNTRRHEQDKKIANSMGTHAHHLVGYSSADDYEAFLIGDMTTDQEFDEVPQITSRNKLSAGGSQDSAKNSASKGPSEGATVDFRNSSIRSITEHSDESSIRSKSVES
jgi:hypothetical protein